MARILRRRARMLRCIDASQAILRYEKSLFKDSEYIVVTASSAREGLRFAMLCKFDVVLLDYQMADIDGHDFAQALRLLRPETLVVMFSSVELPAETYNLVDAVVAKTGSIRDWLPTVARLCDLSSPD